MAVTKDETIDIEQLKPDPRNPRKHRVRNVNLIVDSLRELGTGRSILIDEKDQIIAGNGVREGAKIAGIKKVRIVDADGETLIAVRRTGLTPKEKKRMALMNNRTGELAEWDADVLREMAASEQKLLDGLFTSSEWAEVVSQIEAADAGQPEIAEMELLPYEYYDYLVLFFRNQLDFLKALDKLKVGKVGFKVGGKKTRKIGLGRVLDGPTVIAQLR